MIRNCIKIIMTVVVVGVLSTMYQSSVFASTVVVGKAVIENNNVSKAKEEARKDALRSLVENVVGVSVKSETTVINAMVVKDEIISKSEGYVSIKQVLREWQENGLYYIQMEVDADSKKIQSLPEDLKARLREIPERSKLQIAVIGINEAGAPEDITELQNYIGTKLRYQGFKVIANDEVRAYIANNLRNSSGNSDKVRISNEVRKIVRQNSEGAKAILRGELSTVKVELKASQVYVATIKAAFELISLDSNQVDPVADYYKAVGATPEEAIRLARDQAVTQSLQTIANFALETVQDQNIGGEKLYEYTLQFRNIKDGAKQRKQIVSILEELGCEIVNETVTKQGYYMFSIESKLKETKLKTKITDSMEVEDASAQVADDVGGKKLVFAFK